ncbi:MAG: choice-of-anchor Q domain-containing protein, partial [Synergistaceae bacterium]
SSAINNGTDVDAPERDQRGMSRESSPDIGAYEYIKPNEPAVPDDPAPKAYKKSSGCNTGGSVGFWGFLAVLALPIVRAGVIGRKK